MFVRPINIFMSTIQFMKGTIRKHECIHIDQRKESQVDGTYFQARWPAEQYN